MNKQKLTIPGYNDRPMAADLTFDENQPDQPMVIYAHGINGFKDWGGTELIAQRFAKAGIAFLKFNFSHNGTTPPHPTEFVELEAYGNDNYSIRQQELKMVVDFCYSDEFPLATKDITLIGHSRGGTDVILYAPTDDRVDRLISWAAPSQAQTPWQKWDDATMKEWKEKGVIYRENGRTQQQMPIYYQLYEDYKANKDRLDVEAAARKVNKPWLIVHGDDDEAVFVKSAYELREWQPEASVLIIESTGHTFGRSHPWEQANLPEASQKLVKKCVEFILN